MVVKRLRRFWADLTRNPHQEIIDNIRARGPIATIIIEPQLKVRVVDADGNVMRDDRRDEVADDLGESEDTRTDSQRINCTFWDNMEERGISFEDRVKVLESMRDALNEHCGTLYIP